MPSSTTLGTHIQADAARQETEPSTCTMPTDRWSIVLLVIAGYLAVMFLVRLMIRRRDRLVEQFRGEMEEAKRRKAAQDRKSKAGARSGKAA